MEALVAAAIPDAAFRPSDLHRLLLNLPWADVFTTNYDTLLERAAPAIFGRKYEVVNNAADLAATARPRIIKLHGSFPSHRPFVLTEEDFRTYPRRNAAFVNAAQQAVMENTLCLLGFSGDDPNFLLWSGWVRDQLGPQMPNIYLIGLLNLAPSRRRVLENRNVTPIDLSPLFSRVRWADRDIRHERAIEWFLHSLFSWRPLDILAWPSIQRDPVPSPHPDIDSLIPQQNTLPLATPAYPAQHSLTDADELRKISSLWHAERKRYPGWVTLPVDRRSDLRTHTDYWILVVFNNVEKLNPPESLQLLFEISWRMQLCLFPLDDIFAEIIVQLLIRFDPFPHLTAKKSISLSPATNELFKPTDLNTKHWDWSSIQEWWIELAFWLLQAARLRYDIENAKRIREGLEPIASERHEWKARFLYESALCHLFEFRPINALEMLERWPSPELSPRMALPRASILSALGMHARAREEVETVLEMTRDRMLPGRDDITLLSIESWALEILSSPNADKIDFGFWEQSNALQSRLSKLEAYRCDPGRDVGGFRNSLSRPADLSDEGESLEYSFDPNRLVNQQRSSFRSINESAVDAIGLLLLMERAGLPAHCLLMAESTRAEWMKRIARQNLVLAICSLARLGSGTTTAPLDIIFDRQQVAVASQNEIDLLFRLMFNAAEDTLNLIQASQNQGNRAVPSVQSRAFAFEVLSRLTFRLDRDRLERLFSLAARAYSMPLPITSVTQEENLQHLFERLAFAYPVQHLSDLVPMFLSLPLPANEQGEIWLNRFSTDPLSSVITPSLFEWDHSLLENCHVTILALIEAVASGNDARRFFAASRLDWLHRRKLIPRDLLEPFARALWSRTSQATGLPDIQRFLTYVYLIWPELISGHALSVIRKFWPAASLPPVIGRYLTQKRSAMFPGFGQVNLSTITDFQNSTMDLLDESPDPLLIQWTSTEANQLLERFAAWWHNEQKGLKSLQGSNAMPTFSDRHNVERIVTAFATCVVPYLEDEAKVSLASQIAQELEDAALTGAEVWIAVMLKLPNHAVDASRSIRQALISSDRTKVFAGVDAILSWLVGAQRSTLPPLPTDLVDELVGVIYRRQPVGLNTALVTLGKMIRINHSFLSSANMHDLSVALDSLCEELKMRPWTEGSTSQTSGGNQIHRGAVPMLRASAVGLALRMKYLYEEQSLAIPSSILTWVNGCEVDLLPEVQRSYLTVQLEHLRQS